MSSWCVQKTSDGGAVFVGSTNSSESGEDGLIAKLDKDGSIEWQKVIGGNKDDWLTSVRQTHDNWFIVTGSSEDSFQNQNLLAARLDENGNVSGCEMVKNSDLAIQDTKITAVNANALVSNSQATVVSTSVREKSSSAVNQMTCYQTIYETFLPLIIK